MNFKTRQLIKKLEYLCSPDAERVPDGQRLSDLINLVNKAIPLLEAGPDDEDLLHVGYCHDNRPKKVMSGDLSGGVLNFTSVSVGITKHDGNRREYATKLYVKRSEIRNE